MAAPSFAKGGFSGKPEVVEGVAYRTRCRYRPSVRFTLTFDGQLPPSASAPVKQQIRESLHPQLKELWSHEPLVHDHNYLKPLATDNTLSVLTEVGGHVFAPLVTQRLWVLAELSIGMLRPEPPGGIVTDHGDIDNRLKTLFDALRAPSAAQEIKPGAPPSSVTGPTFTLLDDDRLITRVSVETDRLLAPPQSLTNYTRLTIEVSLRASRVIYGNQNLIA